MNGVHRWQSGVSMAEEPLGGTRVILYEQINETKSRYWSRWIYPPPNVSVSLKNRPCPVCPRSTRINRFLSSTAHLMKDIMVWVGRTTVSRPFWWADCTPFMTPQEHKQRGSQENDEPWVHIKSLESLKGHATDFICQLSSHGKCCSVFSWCDCIVGNVLMYPLFWKMDNNNCKLRHLNLCCTLF